MSKWWLSIKYHYGVGKWSTILLIPKRSQKTIPLHELSNFLPLRNHGKHQPWNLPFISEASEKHPEVTRIVCLDELGSVFFSVGWFLGSFLQKPMSRWSDWMVFHLKTNMSNMSTEKWCLKDDMASFWFMVPFHVANSFIFVVGNSLQ